MKPLDIFSKPSHDFIGFANEVVYINKVATKAIITTSPEFKDDAIRIISTPSPIKRGDIVFYDNRYWMTISQADSKRYESYKARIRLIEHNIIFDLRQGMPTGYPTKYFIKCPAIVEPTSDAVLASTSEVQMTMIEAEIHVHVQENDTTTLLRKLRGSKGRILFGHVAWDVIHVSYVEKGLLDLTCRISLVKDTDKFTSDGVQEIADTDIEFLDDSMYMNATPVEPDKPVDPDPEPNPEPLLPLPSSAETTSVRLTHYNKTTGEIGWRKESQADNFIGFKGYRVKVYVHTAWSESLQLEVVVEDVADMVSYVIGKGYDGQFGWFMEVYSIFTDGTTTVEMKKQVFESTVINALNANPPLW